MPESLTDLISQSFSAVNSVQGLVIAFIASLTMRKYSSIVYLSLFAIIIDQFVTIAYERQIWGGKSVAEAMNEIVDSLSGLDATVVIIRFIGFMVVITAFYGLKSLFRN